jgi:proteasome lid subunit RPN8/RPN11
MNLKLAPGVLDEAIQHAKDVYPNEGCGLIVGWNTGNRFIRVTNIAASPDSYEMNPTELIAAFRNIRANGEKLLAIVHSHPHGPAEASKTDVERAYYPEAAHLIISLAELDRPQAVAFRIVDGRALPIELHVIV